MEIDREALYRIAETYLDTQIDQPEIEEAVRMILGAIGENPDREGLLKTPERVARMYEELLSGYRVDPVALVNGAVFDVAYDEMVLVRDIEFYSLCEHHLLPFIGRAHVAYLPRGRIQDPTHCGYVCPSFAGTGANDATDCRFSGYLIKPNWGCCCGGRITSLCHDARCEETWRENDNFFYVRVFQKKYCHAAGVFRQYFTRLCSIILGF